MSSYNHCDFAEYDELPQLVTKKCFLPGEEKARVNCMKKKETPTALFCYMFTVNLVLGDLGWGFFPQKRFPKAKPVRTF